MWWAFKVEFDRVLWDGNAFFLNKVEMSVAIIKFKGILAGPYKNPAWPLSFQCPLGSLVSNEGHNWDTSSSIPSIDPQGFPIFQQFLKLLMQDFVF